MLTHRQFFLRGTRLSQLSEEYSTCLENISQTRKVLSVKLEALSDLGRARDEARARYNEAKEVRKAQNQVDQLNKELVWAHVTLKEQALRAQVQVVNKAKRRVSKFQEEVEQANVCGVQLMFPVFP